MNFIEFETILQNLSLVSRVRFKDESGIRFSVIRTFDGWVIVDTTGFINFRFTSFETDPADRGNVNLKFSPYPDNDRGLFFHIGAVNIHGITEVDTV